MSHALVLDSDTTEQDTAQFPTFEARCGDQAPEIARKVISYVLEHFAEEIRLEDLAVAAGMTRFNFCRRFHKECGLPPVRWLWNFRAILAREFIALDPRWSLTDVAFACGFTSSAHFSRSFKLLFKVSPSKFRKEQISKWSVSREQAASMNVLFCGGDSPILRTAMERALSVVPGR